MIPEIGEATQVRIEDAGNRNCYLMTDAIRGVKVTIFIWDFGYFKWVRVFGNWII